MLLWTAVLASAGTEAQTVAPRPIAGHAVFELRVGVDRVGPEHPFLCAEGYPLGWLSFEACGTGAGLLHQGAGTDFAHFRSRAKLLDAQRGRAEAGLYIGAGFAEVQTTADEPGFRFGRAQEPEPIEAAGPEGSLSVKGKYWADRGARTYLSADLTGGVAAIPAAPEVIGHGGPAVPFASFTVGLGF